MTTSVVGGDEAGAEGAAAAEAAIANARSRRPLRPDASAGRMPSVTSPYPTTTAMVITLSMHRVVTMTPSPNALMKWIARDDRMLTAKPAPMTIVHDADGAAAVAAEAEDARVTPRIAPALSGPVQARPRTSTTNRCP